MDEKKPTGRKKLWVWIGAVSVLLVTAGLVVGVVYVVKHPSETVSPARPAASDLLYLFDRPAEPIFSLRGINRDVAFDVPHAYLPERYRQREAEVREQVRRAAKRVVMVPEIEMPAERFADINTRLPFRSAFTRSAPPFLALVIRFWHFFDESSSVEDLLARAVWARLHFNPEMILDALMLYMLRSPLQSVRDLRIPELPEYIPELYVNDEFFAKAREEMHMVPPNNRAPVAVARNVGKDDESVLWYFREDPHFHVFHWKWHVYYPAGTDDDQYVDLPRRGELFVHLHRQFTARYNAERFTNGLPAVLPMDVHKPLPKGYFPKMVHLHGSKGTVGRQDNATLLPLKTFVDNHDKWIKGYERVLDQGFVVLKNGTQKRLVDIEGLDIISNLLEGNTVVSPDYNFYGNVHNDLHANLPRAADPIAVHNEPLTVTSFITTVAKDPAFFNIHQLMDDLYEKYKKKYTLPYDIAKDLTPLPGVTLHSVAVRTANVAAANELSTYYQQSDLDVSLGLDYTPAGRQYARFTHLQHRPFHYELRVTNNESRPRRVFVRLALLMVQDEKGAPLDLDFRRRFSLLLDVYEAVLAPGDNTLRRQSTQSALTIDNDAIYAEGRDAGAVRRGNVCRCGWPQGLLLPRGSAAGTPYQLLAMVTDYEQDKAPTSGSSETCDDGWLMCGVIGSAHYPDVRAMGFPLDRPFPAGVASLEDLLTPNMALADVRVTFENRTEPPTAVLQGDRSTSWMPTAGLQEGARSSWLPTV